MTSVITQNPQRIGNDLIKAGAGVMVLSEGAGHDFLYGDILIGSTTVLDHDLGVLGVIVAEWSYSRDGAPLPVWVSSRPVSPFTR
ncbi:MAG: hypothetical protein SFV81_18015 [Pirellulaceae bacterium]|nr:hypothetical protein [Pirellulaceae bacterium]